MSDPTTFLELIRVERDSSAPDRYTATFQARSPEGEFQVTISLETGDESKVFRLARHQMRRMLARLAAVTSEWSFPASPPNDDGSKREPADDPEAVRGAGQIP